MTRFKIVNRTNGQHWQFEDKQAAVAFMQSAMDNFLAAHQDADSGTKWGFATDFIISEYGAGSEEATAKRYSGAEFLGLEIPSHNTDKPALGIIDHDTESTRRTGI